MSLTTQMFSRVPLLLAFVGALSFCACAEQVIDESARNGAGQGNNGSKSDNVTDLPAEPTLNGTYAWTISSELDVETLESGETEKVYASVSGLVSVEQTEDGLCTQSLCGGVAEQRRL